MKTKQLANILIKILGLSAFIHSIPGLITGFYDAVRVQMAIEAGTHYFNTPSAWIYPISSLVMAAIGVYLIIQSRQVTELLFKSDDE